MDLEAVLNDCWEVHLGELHDFVLEGVSSIKPEYKPALTQFRIIIQNFIVSQKKIYTNIICVLYESTMLKILNF